MRLTAGTLVHRDEKYLARCLETLVAQEGIGELGKEWQIIVRDNGAPEKGYIEEAKGKFPQIIFLMNEENTGFAHGHNEIIRRYPAEFHAVLNNDILFTPDFLAKITNGLQANSTYGSATGKLLHWHFGGNPERTNIIDTVGIGITKNHRFFDRGQGEEDRSQYDGERTRFGGSGAAVIYRKSDLEKVKYEGNEYFDETMFMYKEDCDLAERLVAIGKPCLVIPEAHAWHDRTASSTIKRSMRSKRERTASAAHHSIIIMKHWQWFPLGMRIRILFYEILRWKFLFFCEPSIFFAAWKLWRGKRSKILQRRKATKHLVPFSQIASLFQ
ncbi:MAG TPA: glycosyltransferase [Candidatus Peribacterales bacterium]|nr:glycosyltransferase [Candidatus Peribacterales bacterium]